MECLLAIAHESSCASRIRIIADQRGDQPRLLPLPLGRGFLSLLFQHQPRYLACLVSAEHDVGVRCPREVLRLGSWFQTDRRLAGDRQKQTDQGEEDDVVWRRSRSSAEKSAHTSQVTGNGRTTKT